MDKDSTVANSTQDHKLESAPAPVGSALPNDTLAAIKTSGIIKIGYTNSPPHSYTDATNERLTGYSIEMGRAVVADLARRLDRPIEPQFVEVDPQNRYESLENGTIDLLCSADRITLTAREKVSFTQPIHIGGLGLAVRKGTRQELGELHEEKVAMMAGTGEDARLDRRLRDLGIVAEFVPVRDHVTGIRAVVDGRAFAYLADYLILHTLVSMSTDFKVLMISQAPLTTEKVGMVVRRNDDAFRLAVDRGLTGVLSGAAGAALQRKYFPSAGALRSPVPLPPEPED